MTPDLFAPADLQRDTPPPLSDYGWRMLAEGDSWFSIGATGNFSTCVLLELELPRSCAIVNCAEPGATLQRMVDRRADVVCRSLLVGRRARHWDAVLLSAGGNDLVAAAETPPTQGGRPTPPERRLLRAAAEVGHARTAADWVSDAGWALLAAHLRAEFSEFAAWRNAGPSATRPLLLHTYATPVARPAGTLEHPLGWLLPALRAHGVPAAWWQPVTALLFERLRLLLLGLDAASGSPHALARVHVFDSATQVPLVAAAPTATGLSGDWVNEIHLSTSGYRKFGRAFGHWIAEVLAGYP